MAVFGQGINPALGRIDYTPYAQGAAMGAQGVAQGISNFSQSVSQGISNFLKKKEEKEIEKQGVAFIKGQIPGLSDEAALAGYKAVGPVAFVKFQQDMAQSRAQQDLVGLQIGELKRGIAEQERLRQALATPPAASAIQAGARFEQLPTGRGAFAQAPSGVEDFISRAQTAGVSPSLYAQPALQLAQVQETLAQARQREAAKPLPGYATPEEALKESTRLAGGQKGFAPSFTVVQGRYFPIFRENPPSTFEPKDVQLAAESAQKRLDDFKSRFSTAIGAEQSAILVQEGIKKGVKTGMFTPLTTYLKRAANDAGIKMEGLDEEVLAQKGISGMQAGQIQLLARGLGSMSNADREFFVASVSGVTDPTKANQFFAELTIENAKLARQDQAYVRELERKGTSAAEINRLMDERIESRNVAKSVYDRVFTGKVNLSSNAAQFAN